MVVNIEDVKKDDEDLDEFEEIEDELKEEKKEDDKKINWKKILPYVGVGVIFYFIGKRNSRFKVAHRYTFRLPNNWNNKDLKAINEYVDAMNKYYVDNHLVLCYDKKKKNCFYMDKVSVIDDE